MRLIAGSLTARLSVAALLVLGTAASAQAYASAFQDAEAGEDVCGPGCSAVVRLTPDEMASTFGGQSTEQGVVTTVGNMAAFASGARVAGAINADIAFATVGSTVATTIGTCGALVGAYNIAQGIFDTVGVQIANNVYSALSPFGVSDSGMVIGSNWQVSDLNYLSDFTFSSGVEASIGDWYCGGMDCFCDSDWDCDVDLACDQWGYCSEYYLVYE